MVAEVLQQAARCKARPGAKPFNRKLVIWWCCGSIRQTERYSGVNKMDTSQTCRARPFAKVRYRHSIPSAPARLLEIQKRMAHQRTGAVCSHSHCSRFSQGGRSSPSVRGQCSRLLVLAKAGWPHSLFKCDGARVPSVVPSAACSSSADTGKVPGMPRRPFEQDLPGSRGLQFESSPFQSNFIPLCRAHPANGGLFCFSRECQTPQVHQSSSPLGCLGG